MESRVNYTIVGLFVIGLFVAIVVVSLWLSVGIEKKQYKIYLTYMNESVSGLSDQAPVKYNGVKVGFVSEVKLNLQNPQQVILVLQIEPNVPITVDTEAVLMEQGLTGIAYVGLRGGSPNAKLLEPQLGQKYPVIKSAPSFLLRLDTAVQGLTENIDVLSNSVKSLLSKDNIRAVSDSLKNIDKVTTTLANNSQEINSGLKSFDKVMSRGAKAINEIPPLIKQFNASAVAVANMSQNVTIAAKAGDNTFAGINDQILPELYNTVRSIKTVSDNLKGLSRELKQNPSVLIRGRATQAPGPGEHP